MSWKIASRSPPDSILEPPNLDFGGSGLRFWPILQSSGIDFSAKSRLESVSYQQVRFSWFRPKFVAFWGSFLRSGHFTDEMPSMPKKPRMPSSKVWTNCNQNVGFHFPMCLQQCIPADASLKCMAVPQRSWTNWVRRRWPPLGGVQWNWGQIGRLGLPGRSQKPPNLLGACVQDACQVAPKRLPKSPRRCFLKDFRWIWEPFFIIFGCEN